MTQINTDMIENIVQNKKLEKRTLIFPNRKTNNADFDQKILIKKVINHWIQWADFHWTDSELSKTCVFAVFHAPYEILLFYDLCGDTLIWP